MVMTLDEAVKELKEYLNGRNYIKEVYGATEDEYTDFDRFCIKHCLSIEIVLNELEKAGLIKWFGCIVLSNFSTKHICINLVCHITFGQKYTISLIL